MGKGIYRGIPNDRRPCAQDIFSNAENIFGPKKANYPPFLIHSENFPRGDAEALLALFPIS